MKHKKLDILKKVTDPLGKEIIFTKSCYYHHIMYGHPSTAMWLETTIRTIKNPDVVYEDIKEVFHYLKKIIPEIKEFFEKDDEFLEVSVKKMYDDKKKEFWGIATFFPITMQEKTRRQRKWQKI